MSQLSGFRNRTAMEINVLCSQYIYIPNLREFLEIPIIRKLLSVIAQNVDVMDTNADT